MKQATRKARSNPDHRAWTISANHPPLSRPTHSSSAANSYPSFTMTSRLQGVDEDTGNLKFSLEKNNFKSRKTGKTYDRCASILVHTGVPSTRPDPATLSFSSVLLSSPLFSSSPRYSFQNKDATYFDSGYVAETGEQTGPGFFENLISGKSM